MTAKEEARLLELLRIEEKFKAQERHLKFMEYTWMIPSNPFTPGFHTRRICARLDEAFQDLRRGISSYLIFNVHPRAGKSEIVSRYLPPHFIGEFPSYEAMLVSYQFNKAEEFSSFGRNVIRSEKYRALYPDIRLSEETNKKSDWVIVDPSKKALGGKVWSSGLRSGLTGNGAHLAILDDYVAGRKEAESPVIRDNIWSAFTDDFMTRLGPAHIVCVTATQWHTDDVTGRILKAMEDDSKFPKFERMAFPAKADDYRGEGKYPGKFLFLERFPDSWYETRYAVLGKYSSSALMDCNPTVRGGNVIPTSGIVYETANKFPAWNDTTWVRAWDLAHTAKQTQSDDPDYTSGTMIAITEKDGDPIPHIWIRHWEAYQLDSVERDKKMKARMALDDPTAVQVIESSLDSKDAFHYIQLQNLGRTVEPFNMGAFGDKFVRVLPAIPSFEAKGHVHVLEADWNEDWLDFIVEFDGLGKKHDDPVDNISCAWHFLRGDGTIKMSGAVAQALSARRKRR